MSVRIASRTRVRALAGSVTLALMSSLVIAVTAAVPAAAAQRPQPQEDPSVPVRLAAEQPAPVDDTPGEQPAAPVWPVADAADAGLAELIRAGGLPLRAEPVPPEGSAAVAPPSRMRFEVLDRAAAEESGVNGLLLRIRRSDGASDTSRVRLSVDYSAFRNAYGADWGARLGLTAMAGTQPKPVGNNITAGVLTADVEVSGQDSTLALAGTPASPAGDFSASPLQSSSVWQAGGSSGDFGWSYPMRMPPGLGGPEPGVELRYSSSSVDGRISGSNTQTSWIGEGFDWQPGFIERRYRSCGDDTGGSAVPKRGDLCWATDNAVLSFGGSTAELLKDPAGFWRLRGDDGTRVKRETTGSSAKNGDNDGEHWVVTTPDGTQYWFGHNKPPGWATNKPETNSVWTVPVYGNHANEPCSTGTQFCTQAWRWNLDFVKDPSGNTVTYWYGKETNVYMRAQATRTEYVRGGYLDHIDYGTRADTAYGTAPMQVKFDTGNRCLATDCTAKTPANWPDTPWDLACTTSTTTSCLIASPTFWTSRRLTTVTSKVRNGTAYKLVESWALRHSFPTPGDATRARLWLAAIGHTGHVGGPVTVPDVTFTGVQKPNRVDANDHSPPMIWRRLAHIGTETGASIDVTYSDADCVVNTRMPSAPETNNLRCFPVRWTPDGYTAPVQDYFHKYVVTVVTETDLALPSDARSPRTITRYDYPDPPAWRYTDDDGIIDAKSKTWSVWRGYSRVQVTEGDPDDQTRAETRYFRGMHGDRQGSNAPPRSVTLPAAGGAPAVADEDAFAGMPREEIVYNGPGTEVSATVYEPWQSEPTATRTVNGSTVYARHTGVAAERERTTLDGGRPVRRTMTRTTFDGYGMPIEEENLGDETVPDDQRCTLTSYARNTTAWLVSYPSRVQEFGVDCVRAKGPGLTEADIISDERTSYDQQSFGTAPTRGLVSRVEELKTWTSAAAGYHVTSAVTHDEYGREKNVTDERGNVTLHDYVPATGGPVTATVVRNALQWETRETLEPAWGLPTETEDANDKVTRRGYDGLGRLNKVWLPGRTTTDTPNMSFAYHVRNTAATVVATATLLPNGASTTKYTLFDAHLRRRQTQERAAGTGGVLITDTHYDSAGRSVKVSGPRVADGAASVTLVQPVPDAQVPTQTVTDYDGAGRVAEETFLVNGARKWSTTTRYGGDRTDVTPPQGGTPTSTVVDAYDRPVQLWQYHGATASGDHDTTAYRYDRKGQKTAVTDPAGNNWTYEYDVRGRQKVTSDPDKGGATMTYNDAGDLLTTTDSRGNTLAYTYDVLGRRTSLRDGSATGPVRAEWAYDTISPTVTLRGQLAKTTRWVNGEAYVEQMLGYDDGYRPTGRSVIIPAGQTGVAGTYNYAYGYHPDGSPASIRLPQIGNLPTETLVPEYNDLGLPTTLRTNLSSTGANTYYVTATSYTRYGEVAVLSRGHESGRWMDTLRQYEIGTRRLSNILTTRETEPALVADQRYGYDAPGNVTKIADVPAAGTADTQCFGYDRMRRLTEAWTPASGDCAAARSVAALGGPAPYWQSFTYDNVGNRRTSVDHGATDSTREYTYPAARAAQPHTLRSVRTTGPGAGTATYTYDPAGNTLARPGPNGQQTLSWDTEGQLETSIEGGAETRYFYDADGNRLVTRDPAGRTLYLPEGLELRAGTSGAPSGTRYYTHAGQTFAMRDASGLTWLVEDHQGTSLAAVKSADQAVTLRRQKPFGESRGAAVAWPGDSGFVGGTVDRAGTVHLGLREYDRTTGNFLSVDPIVNFSDPQQTNGYTYANSTPVTMSDPSGLMADNGGGSGGPSCTGSCAGYVAHYTQQAQKAQPRKKSGCTGSCSTYRDYYTRQAKPRKTPTCAGSCSTYRDYYRGKVVCQGSCSVYRDHYRAKGGTVGGTWATGWPFKYTFSHPCDGKPKPCVGPVGAGTLPDSMPCADDPSYQLCVKEAKDPGSVNKGVPGVWYAHVAGCGVVICVEISNEQQRDVKINIDWGWGGKEKMNIRNGGFGWAGVGYKSAPHSMRGEGDWQMCGAVRVGACYFGGERKSGGYWHGGGIIFGLGVSGHYEN